MSIGANYTKPDNKPYNLTFKSFICIAFRHKSSFCNLGLDLTLLIVM